MAKKYFQRGIVEVERGKRNRTGDKKRVVEMTGTRIKEEQSRNM